MKHPALAFALTASLLFGGCNNLPGKQTANNEGKSPQQQAITESKNNEKEEEKDVKTKGLTDIEKSKEGDFNIEDWVAIRDEVNGFQISVPRNWQIGKEEKEGDIIVRKFFKITDPDYSSIVDIKPLSEEFKNSKYFYILMVAPKSMKRYFDKNIYNNKNIISELDDDKGKFTNFNYGQKIYQLFTKLPSENKTEARQFYKLAVDSFELFSPIQDNDKRNVWYIDARYKAKFKYEKNWHKGEGNIFYQGQFPWNRLVPNEMFYTFNDRNVSFDVIKVDSAKLPGSDENFKRLKIFDLNSFPHGRAERKFLHNGFIYNFQSQYDKAVNGEESLKAIKEMIDSLVFTD